MELLFSEQIYERFILTDMMNARRFLWIATADIKSTFVRAQGRKFVSILQLFASLVRKGVEVRLIHAKEPGPFFRKEFDRFPELVQSDRFERYLCPRNHAKCIIVDGRVALVGSANLTGAGLGAKGKDKRNFEISIRTEDPNHLKDLMNYLDALTLGDYCQSCKLRSVCPDPIA
ncbi:MAG: phospholipase [Leptospiraceae bacterium]|nr:phospholipase [Leptospiraceae bacterium]